jgi:glutamate synthase domain-containing protein 3
LLLSHLELTASRRAKWILDNWNEMASRFIKVFPHEFKRVLGVARSEQGYIPNQPAAVAVMPEAEPLPQEQVQHG